MEKSENLGMQTFDGALFKLFMAGKVRFDDAIANADSPNNLRLRVKLAEGNSGAPVSGSASTEAASGFGELKLTDMEDPEKSDGKP